MYNFLMITISIFDCDDKKYPDVKTSGYFFNLNLLF